MAVPLELARVFAYARFHRTVQFVSVNQEENERDKEPKGRGLRGSRALAQNVLKKEWDLEAVPVWESVVYVGPDAVQTMPKGPPIDVPTIGDFISGIGNQASAHLFKAFLQQAEQHRPELPELPKVPLIVPGNGELYPDTRRS